MQNMPRTELPTTHDTPVSFDMSEPGMRFPIVRHAMRGEPIEILICNRRHEVVGCVVTPQNALQLAMLLIEAAAKEMGHR
jgi:hypothetical protein